MRKTLLITATAALLCGSAHAGWNGQWYELAHTTEDAHSALIQQEAHDSAVLAVCLKHNLPIQECTEETADLMEGMVRRNKVIEDEENALIDRLAPGDTLEVGPQ